MYCTSDGTWDGPPPRLPRAAGLRCHAEKHGRDRPEYFARRHAQLRRRGACGRGVASLQRSPRTAASPPNALRWASSGVGQGAVGSMIRPRRTRSLPRRRLGLGPVPEGLGYQTCARFSATSLEAQVFGTERGPRSAFMSGAGGKWVERASRAGTGCDTPGGNAP